MLATTRFFFLFKNKFSERIKDELTSHNLEAKQDISSIPSTTCVGLRDPQCPVYGIILLKILSLSNLKIVKSNLSYIIY